MHINLNLYKNNHGYGVLKESTRHLMDEVNTQNSNEGIAFSLNLDYLQVNYDELDNTLMSGLLQYRGVNKPCLISF